MPIHTINSAVNYVLNIKQEEAFNKRISFICSLNMTKDIHMKDSDLYLLLSNLLDNAITHIGIGKTIRVIIKEIKNTTMIQIRNSVNGKVIDSHGNFYNQNITDKHGYGIKTIQSITEKYDGTYFYN